MRARIYTHLLSISFSLSLSLALSLSLSLSRSLCGHDEGVCNARVQVHNTQPYILLSRSYSPSTLSPWFLSSFVPWLAGPFPSAARYHPAPFRGPPRRRRRHDLNEMTRCEDRTARYGAEGRRGREGNARRR